MSSKCSMSAKAEIREVNKLLTSRESAIKLNHVPNMYKKSLGFGVNGVNASRFVVDAA